MHTFVTLPFQQVPVKLQKISATLYFQAKSNKFYKSTVLDPLTCFIRQDLGSRQNIVFTEYDPSFLVLKQYENRSKINIKYLPRHLTQQMFLQFGKFENIDEDTFIIKDNNKILDFLEKRALSVLQLIQKKGYYYNENITLISEQNSEKKVLPLIVIEILKQNIPSTFVQDVVLERFKPQRIKRPICMDHYQEEPENKAPPKKKSYSKPKPPPVIPKNQKSLFGFVKKGQKKEE